MNHVQRADRGDDTAHRMALQMPGRRRKPLQRLCRCGDRIDEGKRADARFCSDACRFDAWDTKNPRQKALDFTPPPAPVPPVVDQRVPKQERRRLRRMSRLILARLEQGPASNRELAQMFPPGAAWRTRLSDVRFHLRGGNRDCEPIPHHDCGGGLVWYWLREP